MREYLHLISREIESEREIERIIHVHYFQGDSWMQSSCKLIVGERGENIPTRL